jgi:hypothetical protein
VGIRAPLPFLVYDQAPTSKDTQSFFPNARKEREAFGCLHQRCITGDRQRVDYSAVLLLRTPMMDACQFDTF